MTHAPYIFDSTTAHTAAAHVFSLAAIAGAFEHWLPTAALIPPAVFYMILSAEKVVVWRRQRRKRRAKNKRRRKAAR